MKKNIRVLVVEEHASFRQILVTLLQQQGYTVVAALPGRPLAEAVSQAQPAIAIINYKNTQAASIENLRFMHAQYPSVRILVSSLFPYHLPMHEFAQLGVAGIYIKSEMSGEQLLQMLESIASKLS